MIVPLIAIDVGTIGDLEKRLFTRHDDDQLLVLRSATGGGSRGSRENAIKKSAILDLYRRTVLIEKRGYFGEKNA